MTKSCVSRATLLASALLCAAPAFADSCGSSTIKNYTRRSDSRAKYRQWVGNVSGIKIDRFEAESWYGIVSLTPGFAGTFKSDNIADCLFGSECCCDDDCCSGRTIKVQGSSVENRDSKAWLADYFYLPRNYDGCFSVDPRIRTFFMDIDWYLGMDEWVSGMYWRMYGSVVHTSWDLNFCDRGHTSGDAFLDHPCGYFSPKAYDKDKLLQSFKDYACGGVPAASDKDNNEIVWNGLKYVRMTNCAQKDTGFADLRFELGWNFLNCADYHLGINLQGAAPTGSREKSCFLFSPMIGNGGHGELGAGLHGHYVFWRGEEDNRSCRFLLDLNVTHLFKKCQCRTFDLACKPNSAYMLAAKFEANPEITDALTATTSDFQVGYLDTSTGVRSASASEPNPNRRFAGEYTPVANLTTVNVDVSVGAQVDLVAMFNYTCENFSWDLGYDFWALTCQKYDCVKSCCNGDLCDCNASKDTWALKGDSRMFGFAGLTSVPAKGPGVDYDQPVPLSATQSGATIFTGLNKVAKNDVETASKDNNAKVDSAKYAYARTPQDSIAAGTPTAAGGPLSPNCTFAGFTANPDLAASETGYASITAGQTEQILTSTKPQFLNCNSLSMARTKGLSHTLFTHVSWTFDRPDWTPYLGVGAAVEFGQSCSDCGDCCDPCCSTSCCTTSTSSTSTTNSNCCTPCCEPCGPCLTCCTSEWRLWVKGGLVYGGGC